MQDRSVPVLDDDQGVSSRSATARPDAIEADQFQGRLLGFVRAFGLHRPDATPCGEAVAVSEAHALQELAAVTFLSQTQLCDRLMLEKSTVSRMVSQMAERQWVTRQADPDDGRRARVSLTDEGRRVAQRLAVARRHRLTDALHRIPPEARGGVLEALDVLTKAMNGHKDDETVG